MTSIRKTLLIGASSLAIALTAASANAGYNDYNNHEEPSVSIDDSFNSKKEVEVTKIDDSFNKKTEVDVEVNKDDHSINDSFNKKEYTKTEDNDVIIKKEDNDTYIKKTETDIDIDKDDHSINDSFNKKEITKTEDSNNNKVEESYNTKVEDSYNYKMETEGSFNSSKTSADNRASKDNDDFELKGKDVTASVLEGTVANNSVSLKMGNKGDIAGNWIGDYVQQNADGVNLNLQNVGSNSNNQQAVTIRADVYNTDSLTMGEAGKDHGGMGGGWHGGPRD